MKKVISNDSEINWQGATLSYVYFFYSGSRHDLVPRTH